MKERHNDVLSVYLTMIGSRWLLWGILGYKVPLFGSNASRSWAVFRHNNPVLPGGPGGGHDRSSGQID